MTTLLETSAVNGQNSFTMRIPNRTSGGEQEHQAEADLDLERDQGGQQPRRLQSR